MNSVPSTASYPRMHQDVDRPECDRAMRHLWEYLDGELSFRETRAIDDHVLHCERCYPAMMSARRMLSAVAATRWTIRAPAGLRERFTRMRAPAPRDD